MIREIVNNLLNDYLLYTNRDPTTISIQEYANLYKIATDNFIYFKASQKEECSSSFKNTPIIDSNNDSYSLSRDIEKKAKHNTENTPSKEELRAFMRSI